VSNNGSERSQLCSFELRNVGVGNGSVRAEDLAADSEYVLVVLLDSHYCSVSRELVRTLCAQYEQFQTLETEVVPVLPDITGRARLWDQQYELPFPMLADPATEDGSTDAFGVFGQFQQRQSSLPATVLFACADGQLTVIDESEESTLDVPVVERLLERITAHREADEVGESGTATADG